MLKKLKNEKGFTLIEISIVLMVIAVLSLLILPNVTRVNDSVTSSTDAAIVQTVETQKLLYEANNPNDTATLEKLVEDKYLTQQQVEAYNNATTP